MEKDENGIWIENPDGSESFVRFPADLDEETKLSFMTHFRKGRKILVNFIIFVIFPCLNYEKNSSFRPHEPKPIWRKAPKNRGKNEKDAAKTMNLGPEKVSFSFQFHSDFFLLKNH